MTRVLQVKGSLRVPKGVLYDFSLSSWGFARAWGLSFHGSFSCRSFGKFGGTLFWGPYNKGPTIWGTTLGSYYQHSFVTLV